jgi:glucose/arabinose dehydrogenase
VPDDNPFVGRSGARPEIWAYGLRNPWRFSFDDETSSLWIADVGQNRIEEINRVSIDDSRGANFGWAAFEGSESFRDGGERPDSIAPVFEYRHKGGVCSVTGGFVYRGERIAGLRGAYLFADLCVGQVSGLVVSGDSASPHDLGVQADQLTSFGADADGEPYVLSAGDGAVYRLVPVS